MQNEETLFKTATAKVSTSKPARQSRRTCAHKIHQLAEELEMERICEIAQYYLK